MWTVPIHSHRDGTTVPYILSPKYLTLQERCIHGLVNGDTCRIGNWVLFKSNEGSEGVPALGRIHEIVILPGPAPGSMEQSMHTVVLLQQMDIGVCVEPYQMPAISFGNNWVVLDVSVSDMVL
jgi:hypothetical protein